MSKKNSIVLNHKNCFDNSKRILKIYIDFKNKLKKIKSKNFLVSVSGGSDSLALAALCKVYSIENKKTFFMYAHIDHGLRKSSDKEAVKVKKILRKQELNLKILKNKSKIFQNLQHNARKIRYNLLNKLCEKNKLSYIVTGHHKNDQIENFFIRLSRGSGIQGLSSMNTITVLNKKTKILRPLLDVEKSELKYLSKKFFGSYIKDPSNNNDKFLRIKVRKLLPLMEKHGIKKQLIYKSIKNLQSSSRTINFYFLNIYDKIVRKEKRRFTIKSEQFFTLGQEFKLKILGLIIQKLNLKDYPPRSKKLLYAIKIFDSGKIKRYSLGGCLIRLQKSLIIIEKEVKK